MHGKVDFSPLDPQEVTFSPLNVSGAPALGLLQWLLHLPEPSSPDAPLTNHCRGSGGVGNYLFLRLSPAEMVLRGASCSTQLLASMCLHRPALAPDCLLWQRDILSAELCSIVISTSEMLVFPLNGCAGALTPNVMELGGGTFGRWRGSDTFLRVGSPWWD